MRLVRPGTILTFDSKYRDQLTVQEVRKRGKDSLVISRLLGLGQFAPNIDDLLFPWSYEQGSGFVPTNSKHLWNLANKDGLETAGSFPWTGISKNYPPKTQNPSAKKELEDRKKEQLEEYYTFINSLNSFDSDTETDTD